jgi:hypothetical protein
VIVLDLNTRTWSSLKNFTTGAAGVFMCADKAERGNTCSFAGLSSGGADTCVSVYTCLCMYVLGCSGDAV